MIYILSAALALLANAIFYGGISLIFGLAVSGIAETMHGINTDVLTVLIIYSVILLISLTAFIFVLIKYIKRCIKEKSVLKTVFSIGFFMGCSVVIYLLVPVIFSLF